MSHRLTARSHEARPHPTSDASHRVADPQITHNFRPTGLQVRGSLGPLPRLHYFARAAHGAQGSTSVHLSEKMC